MIMNKSVKMLFGLALGLTLGALVSIKMGILVLPLFGCFGMACGMILGSSKKKDNK